MALQLAAHRAGFGLRQASEFSPPADMALEGDGFHRRFTDCDQLARGLGGLAGGAGTFEDASMVVAGVVAGSTAWWLILTTVIGLFHARIDEKALRLINRGCGLLVTACGLAVLVHLALKFA